MIRLKKRQAALLFCSVALVAAAGAAEARPVHKGTHRAMATTAASVAGPSMSLADQNPSYGTQTLASVEAASPRGRGRTRALAAQAKVPETGFGGFTSSSLVSEARKYIGTNPTGRSSLWCGAFMDMVLKRTGHNGGGNLASAYARYGTRVSGPQVGAIAVMGRRGGGHVGVVSGVDPNGNPIIISGNHNRTTAESVYPRGRITAYVLPN